jgi:hypothetical protein
MIAFVTSLQVQIISNRLGVRWIFCHIQLWMQMAKGAAKGCVLLTSLCTRDSSERRIWPVFSGRHRKFCWIGSSGKPGRMKAKLHLCYSGMMHFPLNTFWKMLYVSWSVRQTDHFDSRWIVVIKSFTPEIDHFFVIQNFGSLDAR